MDKNEIIKIYGTDYREMTRELLAAADPASRISSRDMTIGIKPNLVSPTPASYGATTHPEVVAGIIEYLQEHGFYNIIIAEGSWVGDRTSEAFEYCGYDTLAQKYGVELVDTQRDGSHKKDCGGMKLTVCDVADRIDFLINVPVLKGHCQTRMTCALKNSKGLIPDSEKRRFHSMGLHKPIAHLGVGIRQDFIVVDHICGDPDMEDGGNPLVRNCVMAAADPVLIDAFACQILGYSVKDVEYVGMAEKLGVGSADLSKARISTIDRSAVSAAAEIRSECGALGSVDETVGEQGGRGSQADDEAGRGDKDFSRRRVLDVSCAVEEVDSCSACYGSLIPALDRLKREGLLDELTERIAIGQGFRGCIGKLGVGDCCEGFEFFIEGCPPEEDDIYQGLKKYIRKT